MHALLLLSLRSLPPEFKMSLSLSATSLIGIGQAPSLIARSDPEPIGIAPFLPIIRSSCPLSSSTGSLVVVLSGFNNRIWRSFTKSGREDYSKKEDGEGIPQGRGEHVKLPVPIEGIGDKDRSGIKTPLSEFNCELT
ncbi:hypothetical protein U1Q18_044138 [Sarracenia purpurea var. burkii]